MQFEYDPEQLIEKISKRRGIWDSEHTDYRAKNVKAGLWHGVVKELTSQSDVTMSKSEMRELELQLQKKWKSLRDCFQKYLVNPNRSKRPYVYSKQMQFLLKDKKLPEHRKTPIQVGSSDSDDEEEKPKNVWVPKKRIKLQKAEVESDDNDIETTDYTFDMSEPVEMETRNSLLPSEGHSQFAFANVDAQLKCDTEDADRMFLMSLLPHLRSIPEEFRLNVKLELMQVLRAANGSTDKMKYIM